MKILSKIPKKHLILFLIPIFCFLPFYSVFAMGIGDAIAYLPTLLINAIFKCFLLLGKGLLNVGNMALLWAIGNPWTVSYTDPANNGIIKIGWVLLRDFTNMFFILGLAYIGLATSLDIGNKFKTGETFANILLIALLINFTPVICGVVVDITNIISRFFLLGIDFSAMETVYDNQRGVIWNNLDNIVSDWKVALQAIMLFAFALATSAVLLIFAVIFLARAPIIWIYVILSPLAFFFWVFRDVDKRVGGGWSSWWNGFFEISIIAIPGAFFLYLSQQVMVLSVGKKLVNASGLESGFFANLAPYFAVLIFLIFALYVTIKVNGMATGFVMTAAGMATGGAVVIAGKALFGKQGIKGAVPPPKDKPKDEPKKERSPYDQFMEGSQQYAGTSTGTQKTIEGKTGGAYVHAERSKNENIGAGTSTGATLKKSPEYAGMDTYTQITKEKDIKTSESGAPEKNEWEQGREKGSDNVLQSLRKNQVVKGFGRAANAVYEHGILGSMVKKLQETQKVKDLQKSRVIKGFGKAFRLLGGGTKFVWKKGVSPLWKGTMKEHKPSPIEKAFDVYKEAMGFKKESKAEKLAK